MFNKRTITAGTLLFCCDILAAAVAWMAALLIVRHLRLWIDPALYAMPQQGVLTGIAGLAIIIPVAYRVMGLYRARRTSTLIEEGIAVTQAVAVSWLWISMLLGLAKIHPGRWHLGLLLITWIISGNLLRIVGRLTMRSLRRHGVNRRTAAIIGTGRLAQHLCNQIRSSPWTGIRVCYFVAEDHRHPALLLDLPVYAGHTPLDMIRTIDAWPVDTVFVALSGRHEHSAAAVVESLTISCTDIRVVSQVNSLQLLRHEVSQIGDLLVVSLTDSPQNSWRGIVAKRVVDIAGSLAGLVVLSPLMLLIACLVKLTSGGPVLYRQQRVSVDGRPFRILKFRSMPTDAEHGVAVWGSRDDPRATRLGRLLRNTSLDELPQLFNVLKGDMSLVGPRPERPELISRFRNEIPRYMLRHHVKTGITGWAQVNGLRGQTSVRKRIQYDLYYIRNWSLLFDFYILCLTPFRLFAKCPSATAQRGAMHHHGKRYKKRVTASDQTEPTVEPTGKRPAFPYPSRFERPQDVEPALRLLQRRALPGRPAGTSGWPKDSDG